MPNSPSLSQTTNLKTRGIHLAFWIVVTIIFLCDRIYLLGKVGLPNFLICATVRISLLVAIAYLNLYYLIPKFLIPRRYFWYFTLVILTIVAYILLQSLYDLYLFGYILGPIKREIHFAALFYNTLSTIWYLILTIALKLSIDWYRQKELLQKIQIEKLSAEVSYLRSQINPHFLFNVLNNLYSLTLKKSGLAPGIVLKLSEMMEYMLYESNEERVPLNKEINYLQNYMELEKLRQGVHADISFEVNGNPGGHMIAPFLLLPLVENAFKHGIDKSASNSYLRASISINPPDMLFKIENNKSGLSVPEKNSGVGLNILKQRLELLYPDSHTLTSSESVEKYSSILQISLS